MIGLLQKNVANTMGNIIFLPILSQMKPNTKMNSNEDSR
jgi:hypothetical protein